MARVGGACHSRRIHDRRWCCTTKDGRNVNTACAGVCGSVMIRWQACPLSPISFSSCSVLFSSHTHTHTHKHLSYCNYKSILLARLTPLHLSLSSNGTILKSNLTPGGFNPLQPQPFKLKVPGRFYL